MKNRKPRLRKCVVCGLEKEKHELIRIVKNKEGQVCVDPSGKMNGRGAYICNNKESIEKAIKTKVLNKHLKTNVPDEVYEELMSM